MRCIRISQNVHDAKIRLKRQPNGRLYVYVRNVYIYINNGMETLRVKYEESVAITSKV